eukprot:TRINITY_DN9668_c0_g1_i9.p1 TRINITY_DN9668_c0_g1~~TRINITY_DN9668_c0_g1_i9.p1  ORF type:complete len:205 (+),score=45.07 TRINITY_DN9668_c0_g1_i9:53-616(+)
MAMGTPKSSHSSKTCAKFIFALSIRCFVLAEAVETGTAGANAEVHHDTAIPSTAEELNQEADRLYDQFMSLLASENVSHENVSQWLDSARPSKNESNETVVEDSKTLLSKGRSCRRKCDKEMKAHLSGPCRYIDHKLQEQKLLHAKDPKDEREAQVMYSLEHALKVCKQGQKHHEDHCEWRCWSEEL